MDESDFWYENSPFTLLQYIKFENYIESAINS